jgi:hypothetical protein
MTPEEFVKQVSATALLEGVPFARVRLIESAQAKHAMEITKLKGYIAISEASKCFTLETVELINTTCRPHVMTPLPETYPLFLQRLVHDFQSLCGSQLIASHGYPMHGYTLLRNTFDNLVMTSAAIQGLTSFLEIEGIISGQALDAKQIRNTRKSTEFAVRSKMTGKESGLSQSTFNALKDWDELFDFETHGARLTMALSQGWLKGTEPLQVLPNYNETAASLFVNRYCEIAWMLHRLLPLLQPAGTSLPDKWAKNWRVLDESFKVLALSITQQFGKVIGTAIVEFVAKNFPLIATPDSSNELTRKFVCRNKPEGAVVRTRTPSPRPASGAIHKGLLRPTVPAQAHRTLLRFPGTPVGMGPTGVSGTFTARGWAPTCHTDGGEDPGYFQPARRAVNSGEPDGVENCVALAPPKGP